MENNNSSSLFGNLGNAQNGGTMNGGPLLGITNRNSSIVSFSHNISLRLDKNNFLLWKQQILTTIHGYGLEKHLAEDQIPLMFKNGQDEAARVLNSKFVNWRRQHQLLMSWLLASMTKGMLTRVVGCDFACKIWERIRIHFALQTQVKIKQLNTQL